MSRITAKQILRRYIIVTKINSHGRFISNSEMVAVAEWGRKNFEKLHTPMTYERKFRAMRSEKDDMIEFFDVSDRFPNKSEKVWEVRKKETDLFG